MSYRATIWAGDRARELEWQRRFQTVAADLADFTVEPASLNDKPGDIVFVDSTVPGHERAWERLERSGRALFLLVDESAPVPPEFLEGKVDDVLVWPFRVSELVSKIRRFHQIQMWEEVGRLNASFTDLLGRLKDDLQLAERMQKSKLPVRFPEIKGFKVAFRYLAGMKAGGDHLDLAEAPGKNLISMVLSDSSSYGLSSAVLSVLMRVAMKLSADEVRSSLETVRKIQEELITTLGDKDKLSLFYGTVSRKDYKLRYINLGSSAAFYAPPKAGFSCLPSSGPVISKVQGAVAGVENELLLEPEAKLVLLSDGFVDVLGGTAEAAAFLTQYREREAVDALNELVFRVKAKFEDPDDMPAQDCTGIFFDIDSRLIRLATP